MARKIKIKIPEIQDETSGLIKINKESKVLMILGHGAGAGMDHHFMEDLSATLLDHGIATLRYNFLYKEKGGKAPDRPPKAHAAIRAALKKGAAYADKHSIPIVLAGKSFGGRMASQIMAATPDGSVRALVFYGFPLHPTGKPSTDRADHLQEIKIPMLFLQGTRDTLATLPLIKETSKKLRRAKLEIIEGGDHSFKMLKSAHKPVEEVMQELGMKTKKWIWTKLKI